MCGCARAQVTTGAEARSWISLACIEMAVSHQMWVPGINSGTLNKAKLPLYPYYQNVLVMLHKPILTVTRMWATIILWSANSVALRLA